jgi:hypothetical protein
MVEQVTIPQGVVEKFLGIVVEKIVMGVVAKAKTVVVTVIE